MRWKERPKPCNLTSRTVRRFLWWPLKLGDETRWLETATLEQVYVCQVGWVYVDWKE